MLITTYKITQQDNQKDYSWHIYSYENHESQLMVRFPNVYTYNCSQKRWVIYASFPEILDYGIRSLSQVQANSIMRAKPNAWCLTFKILW